MFNMKIRPYLEHPQARRNLIIFWVVLNGVLSLWLLNKTGQLRYVSGSSPEARGKIIWTADRPLPRIDMLLQNFEATSISATPSTPSSLDGIVYATHSSAHASTVPDVQEEIINTKRLGAKVAVIIETKMVTNLVPVILHFGGVLGPEWQTVLFIMDGEFHMPDSAPFQRAISTGALLIRHLPADTSFASHDAVSQFLTRPWLWAQLQTADRVLMFQSDSILCANAPQKVDDFLEFDLLGAPIAPQFGHGFNGGLSIRNPKLMLSIAQNESLAYGEDARTGDSRLKFEDQWFYGKLLETPGVKLPTEDVAKQFAVESIYYDKPLGYHQPTRWQEAKMDEINKWCPEVGMLIGARYY